MLTVACVLRSGGVYTPEYVDALWDGVRSNLLLSHDFVCLSDVSVPCDRVPLRHEWSGWWSKIELFRPDLFRGPVLYLDLDVVVTGSLDCLVQRSGGLVMCRDFIFPKRHNSSVMAWSGNMSRVYETFCEDPDRVMGELRRWSAGRIGDQAFIEDCVPDAGFFQDGLVVSYKRDARAGVPSGARVVSFHGRPKPHEAGGWVRWN